jgi:hypothetical protein
MNKFNQIYEQCLLQLIKENGGVYDNQFIKSIGEILEAGWKNELQKLSDCKTIFGDCPNFIDRKLNSPKIFIHSQEDNNGSVIDWKILPKVVISDNENSNTIIVGAYVKLSPKISKLQLNKLEQGSDPKEVLLRKQQRINTIWNEKIKLNETEPLEVILEINPLATYQNILNKIDYVGVFAFHESVHVYDYIINRTVSNRTTSRYVSSMNGNNVSNKQKFKNYYIDIEMDALMGGAAKELLNFKKSGTSNFNDALNKSIEWGKILNSLKKTSEINRIKGKLLYVWNKY